MFFGSLTIAINGFSMVFGLATIASNGFRWFWTIGQTMRWFRWIAMVYTCYLTASFIFLITNRLENKESLFQCNHFEVKKKVPPLKKAPLLVSECAILAFDPKGEK